MRVKKGRSAKKGGIFIIVIILVIILYVLTSAKKVTPGCVPFVMQESYTVEVPYETTETYVEKRGIGEKSCKTSKYDYITELGWSLEAINDSAFFRCTVSVANEGDKIGEWTLHVKFITTDAGGGPESEPLTKIINPGQTKDFDFYYPTNKSITCRHTIDDAPVKEVCVYPFYENIKRIETVTKNRTETRQRNVTKYKLETGEIVDGCVNFSYVNRVFGYEQGFYLGY